MLTEQLSLTYQAYVRHEAYETRETPVGLGASGGDTMKLMVSEWQKYVQTCQMTELETLLGQIHHLKAVVEYQMADSCRSKSLDARPPTHGLMTVPEAARFLHISPRAVQRHVLKGRLQFVKVGRWTRFEPTALERFIHGRRDTH